MDDYFKVFKRAVTDLPAHSVKCPRSMDAEFKMARSVVAVAEAEVRIGPETKKIFLVYMVRHYCTRLK